MFANVRIMITHNQDKDRGAVNSALGTGVRFYRRTLLIRLTRTGEEIGIHRENLGAGAGCPITPAYACTAAKMQGQTLACVAIYPRCSVPAAAYTAASRVQRVEHVL